MNEEAVECTNIATYRKIPIVIQTRLLYYEGLVLKHPPKKRKGKRYSNVIQGNPNTN